MAAAVVTVVLPTPPAGAGPAPSAPHLFAAPSPTATPSPPTPSPTTPPPTTAPPSVSTTTRVATTTTTTTTTSTTTTTVAPTTTTVPAPTPGRHTPVLSLRRAPELLALVTGMSKLDTALDTTLSDPKLGAVAANSCLVVQAGTMTVYAHNPTRPLIPASNLKLLTATAALESLPASDRFVTTVKGATAPVQGMVAGNLYLIGGGDPLLRTPDYVASLRVPEQIFDSLATLADQVRAAGVTSVTGSVVGDESRYDGQRAVPSWPLRYLTTGEVGPLSALSVNDGFSAFNPTLVPAPQPAQQAAATFTALLQARGITVAGPPAAGTTPSTAVRVTDLASAPLPAVVGEVLRRSDNNGAELLTKELGRQAGSARTTAAGVAAIEARLAADGLPTDGLHMVDGSGLDRSDRVTCQLILAALDRTGPDGALGRGLAVAGQSGTLVHRMAGTAAAGRLRAKTGSLDGVSALSGFVTPPAGSSSPLGTLAGSGVAFSLISNAAPAASASEPLGDRVGVLLAQFPQVPSLALLGP
jgi:D-alanyl-D-alanine carboxypeptidase/D-alanyl-D-alanine-endopeptidase (penicillin-binding protein 4)